MHVTQQLRNNFTTAISTIKNFKIVEESRTHPLGNENMPAALIFTEDEQIIRATKQGTIQNRIITTTVYIFSRQQDNIENSLDALRVEVEKVILSDCTVGNIANDTYLSETNMLIGGDDNDPVGAARMSFVSSILTKTGDPENPIRNKGAFS